MCAYNMCMQAMHPHRWAGEQDGDSSWPGLQAPLQSPSAPAQPDANCQAARSAAAAASVPKQGQVVTTSVTGAPLTHYTHGRTCRNWWKRDNSMMGMLPEEWILLRKRNEF